MRITTLWRNSSNLILAAFHSSQELTLPLKAPRDGEGLSDDNFSVEESADLLHVTFPNYPDIQEMLPAPDIKTFLRTLRAEEQWQTSAERGTSNEMVCQ